MNVYQKLEVDSHKGAELSHILTEAVGLFTNDRTNFRDGMYHPYELFKFVGGEVNKLIAEREGFVGDDTRELTPSECGSILMSAYSETRKDEVSYSYHEMIQFGLDDLLLESLNRTRNPRQNDRVVGVVDFDEGFCNPRKIKLENEG